MWEGSFVCEFFYVGRCVLREWVVKGGGLDRYFGEQELPVGIQECLDRFHRGCVNHPSRKFVPKRDSPYGGGELATVSTPFLLVELECVAMKPVTGWLCEGGLHGEFQNCMGNREHGY